MEFKSVFKWDNKNGLIVFTQDLLTWEENTGL